MNDDLRRRLESLADRGDPRGAETVLAAARRQAAAAVQRPLYVAAALAAAVLAVLGTTAVVVHEDGGDQRLAGTAATSTTTDDSAEVMLAAPTTTTPEEAPRLTREQRASRLRRYSSCDALADASRRKAFEVVGPYGVPTLGGVVLTDAVTTADEGEGSVLALTGGSTKPEFSETNVQEAGVDEPDVVETDGRRLFTIHDDRLWYSTLEDGRARIEGSIVLDDPSDMVLVGDRMVVFGNRFERREPKAVVTVVDVRTPQMGVVSSLVVEGRHVSARVIDGVVRAVVQSSPDDLTWKYPNGDSPAELAAATARNRQMVARAPRDTWLPSLVVEDGRRQVRATRSLVDCNAAYHPQRFAGFGLLTVLTLDPANPDAAKSTAVQADGDRVYASRTKLYVATNGWQRLDNDSRTIVHDPVTQVHAFDITDRTTARYRASGTVRGETIGQFAFSEHDGHLRVASTTPQTETANSSESWVTVLGDNGAALEQVGQVGGLGKGERIYAVRFMGPVGYVVTFRQVDPLYVVDLADPRAPKVVGELKIPGYSSYLHPIGPGLLLGIGQDADDTGRTRGTQVSVFDVSVPSKPVRVHNAALAPGSGSAVDYDHHAFLWWAPTGLALVPVTEYRGPGTQASRVVGFAAGRDALREIGHIAHPDGGRDWPNHVTRAVVVGRTVFTVSEAGILASDLATLAAGEWSPYPASTG
jgi:uncharacterized secreted protein with C-terminal beta-propeller domain